MNRLRFKLKHKQTGLTLGEHKSLHKLRYHIGTETPMEDECFKQEPIRAFIREDGAIGFQRLDCDIRFGEYPIYFLVREDWEIEIKDESKPFTTAVEPEVHICDD